MGEPRSVVINGIGGIQYYMSKAGGIARNNQCTGNKIGISIEYFATPLIEGNLISMNEIGIYIASTANPEMSNNICENNTTYGC